MGIWVRSQLDQSLTMCYGFFVAEGTRVWGIGPAGAVCLGAYGSDAEAGTVLGLIQTAIKAGDHLYIMPAKGV